MSFFRVAYAAQEGVVVAAFIAGGDEPLVVGHAVLPTAVGLVLAALADAEEVTLGAADLALEVARLQSCLCEYDVWAGEALAVDFRLDLADGLGMAA